MTCSRNLCKHLKICYQTKTNREMPQHDFNFFVNLINFFVNKKKVIKYFLFIFIFHIYENFQTKKKKTCHDMCIWMFSITLSHLKELHEFLHMMGAIIIFGKNIFKFSFVIIDWWQSQLNWVHIWKGGKENKMSKDECKYFYNQIRMNHLTLLIGSKIPWSHYIL
jgi:hypothetical protein